MTACTSACNMIKVIFLAEIRPIRESGTGNPAYQMGVDNGVDVDQRWIPG